MQLPVFAAFVTSGMALFTSAVGWVVAVRLNIRTADSGREQWRRETRRDAYADLVVSFHRLYEIIKRTPLEKGLARDADEGVTGEIDQALLDLYTKAMVVRLEGPDHMRNLAVETVKRSDRLVSAWQQVIVETESTSLDVEEVRSRKHLDRMIAEAENILDIGD